MKFAKVCSLLALVFCLDACSSPSDNYVLPKSSQIQNVNGRLQFTTKGDAANVLASLANKSPDDLSEWERQYDFNSLRTQIDINDTESDTLLLQYPPQLSSILNIDREYEVDGNVIWFHEFDLFRVPSDDPSLLAAIKTDPDNPKFDSYREVFIENNGSQPDRNGRVIPSVLSTSTSFILDGHPPIYRFMRDFKSINTGSNWQVQTISCLQYLKASNGGWYLASEIVKYRSVSNVYLNGIYQPWTSGLMTNANGYLTTTLYTGSSQFAGTIQASFAETVHRNDENIDLNFSTTLNWY